MREEQATLREFLQANRCTTVISLVPSLCQAGCSGLQRLSEIARFKKRILDSAPDVQVLEEYHLVWYTTNQFGEASWDKSGCTNYTVAEYCEAIRQSKIQRPDIQNLIQSLTKGLNSNVALVAAFDTTLDKRMFLDGNKRAVALTMIARNNPSECQRILTSQYHVVIIELVSKYAHSLYPSDFLSLCQ